MAKMDLRLYEFEPAMEAIQEELSNSIDMDTGEWIGERTVEEVFQDKMNMELGVKEKALSIGRLILYYKAMAEAHDTLKAKHARKERAAEKAQEVLKEYLKACLPVGFKAKDAEVSIYEMQPSRVQPLVPVEETPVAYRRPSLVSNYSRDLAERIENGMKKQNLPSPFTWDHDKEALKAAIKDCEANGVTFDLAKLEKGRSVVVR
jgi:hypothetical protein